MTWPFGETARQLTVALDDVRIQSEHISLLQMSLNDMRQDRDEAIAAMKAMQRRENMEGIKQTGDEVAALIDDIYARGMSSVASRRNAVSLNIQAAIRKLLTGGTS